MPNEITKTKVELHNFQELTEWGKFAVQSQILPAGVTSMQAMAIIQTGKELGIGPMQALRTMAFVKGRLTLETKLMLALARREGVKIVEIKSEDGRCSVTLNRDGETATCEWTMDMAKKANLTTKDNWQNYPIQMLRWRAICDCLRLIAPDFILGLVSKEEAEDLEPMRIPLGLDPEKAVPADTNGDTISKEQKIKLLQTMQKNKWVVDGVLIPAGIEKLGSLGYENSQQIPKAEYETVFKAFSEVAPVEIKQPELAV